MIQRYDFTVPVKLVNKTWFLYGSITTCKVNGVLRKCKFWIYQWSHFQSIKSSASKQIICIVLFCLIVYQTVFLNVLYCQHKGYCLSTLGNISFFSELEYFFFLYFLRCRCFMWYLSSLRELVARSNPVLVPSSNIYRLYGMKHRSTICLNVLYWQHWSI